MLSNQYFSFINKQINQQLDKYLFCSQYIFIYILIMFLSQQSINYADINDFATQLIIQNPHYKNLRIIFNEKYLIEKLKDQTFIFRLQDEQLKVEKQINAIICNNETKLFLDQIIDFKKSIQKLHSYECFLEIYGYYLLETKTESQRYFVIESEVYSFGSINYEDSNINQFLNYIQKFLNNQISDKLLNKKLALSKNICYCSGYNNSLQVKLNIIDPQFIEEKEDESVNGSVQKESQSKMKVELSRIFVAASKFEEYFNQNHSDFSQQYFPIIDYLTQEIKNKNISYFKISTLSRQELILISLNQLDEKQVCQFFYIDDKLKLKSDQFQLLHKVAKKDTNQDFQFIQGKENEPCFFKVRFRNFKQNILVLKTNLQISQSILDIAKIINHLYDLYQISGVLKLQLNKKINKTVEAIQNFISTLASKFKCFQINKNKNPVQIIQKDINLLNNFFNQVDQQAILEFDSEYQKERELYYKSLCNYLKKINAALVLEQDRNNVKITKNWQIQLQYKKLIKDESIFSQINILKVDLKDKQDTNKFIEIYNFSNIKSLKLMYCFFDLPQLISINFDNIQLYQNILQNLQDLPFWEFLKSITIKYTKNEIFYNLPSRICSSILLYIAIKNQLARVKFLKDLKLEFTQFLVEVDKILFLILLHFNNDKQSNQINPLLKQGQTQPAQALKLFEQQQYQQQQQNQQEGGSSFSIDQNNQTKSIFQVQEQQNKQETKIKSSLFQNSASNLFSQGQIQPNIFDKSFKELKNVESQQSLNGVQSQLKDLKCFIQEKQTNLESSQPPNFNIFEQNGKTKQNNNQINNSLFEKSNKNVFNDLENEEESSYKKKRINNELNLHQKFEHQLSSIIYDNQRLITNCSQTQNMLTFEYENEKFKQIGKLKVVSQIANNKQEFISFECDNRENIDCYFIQTKRQICDPILVEKWQLFSIQSEIFQKIIGQSYKPGCCHHQYNLLIGQLYKQQQHLEHLSLSICVCDYMIENNSFQLYFDTQLHNKLRSLALVINKNYSSQYNLVSKSIFKQIKHLNNLNILKLKFQDLALNKNFTILKKQKRLVTLIIQ
ncbi:transmembrane protein, putative (macronuclear) [Tetrahymena thermophila SB210]|uniref:Transmembrane protein, putative n=1 Tax=Tetrahymena thermophila (strain SB210) TaxID=312017 RepID=W7XF53_TETTS|nr:transmembrane protein, putative [Tetrahymena thermophila SB210]EWS71399.1 transmembrane protein, putative [Tetrahymena thermophila SB210]|eukprot:XP_012656071.1 transmembrane protein, putative [Tetrahymena thermophila SB210]